MEHLLFLFIQLRMLCHYKEKHRTNVLSWAPAPTIKIYVQSHRCNGILDRFGLAKYISIAMHNYSRGSMWTKK